MNSIYRNFNLNLNGSEEKKNSPPSTKVTGDPACSQSALLRLHDLGWLPFIRPFPDNEG